VSGSLATIRTRLTKFQGMPNLDAPSNEVVIATLELGTKHRARTS
jgi:hypothetical protein